MSSTARSKRRPPLRDRYPGQHTARFHVFYLDDTSVRFEGRVPKELADLMVAACVGLNEGERRELAMLADRINSRRKAATRDKLLGEGFK